MTTLEEAFAILDKIQSLTPAAGTLLKHKMDGGHMKALLDHYKQSYSTMARKSEIADQLSKFLKTLPIRPHPSMVCDICGKNNNDADNPLSQYSRRSQTRIGWMKYFAHRDCITPPKSV